MLAALSFLAGLIIAGYGVARWFRRREEGILAEIGQHYERRQQMMRGRIDEGDQALITAYADLDRLEGQKALADARLVDARTELDAALGAKAALEQVLERRAAALATAETQLDRVRRHHAGQDPHPPGRDEALPGEGYAASNGARLKQTG